MLEHRSREAAKASWKSVQRRSGVAGGAQEHRSQTARSWPRPSRCPQGDGLSKSMNARQRCGSGARVLKMRTYTAAEGRNGGTSMRGSATHAMSLFAKHGYHEPRLLSPARRDKGAGKTLIYFLAFQSRKGPRPARVAGLPRRSAWAKARAEDGKGRRITARNHRSRCI